MEARVARVADEKEILDRAVAAFTRTTKIDGRIKPEGQDATICLHRDGKEWTFAVKFKPWLTAATAGLLIQERHTGKGWILVTRHAPAAVAEQLRELHIQYMDTDGNGYVDAKGLVVYVKGHKGAEKRGEIARPFKPAGMQVIFALLCNPGLEGRTYREIAEVAATAVGTVHGTIRDLERTGYILTTGEGTRRVAKREALFDQWVGAYPLQLRPKQFVGRYAAHDPDWWRTVDPRKLKALWGGETAAAIETGYLEPEITTVYIGENLNELVLRCKLTKDPYGKIDIFRKFWHFEHDDQKERTVPLPLIYADLLATGNGRNIQTAMEMREKRLARYFK
jgi:hypothetical protein